MPLRAVAANPLVSQDAGKVAVARGPIVYCAEERDNGANLHLLHPDGNALSGDASRVKVEPFTFQAGAYLDDPQAEGYPDSLFCLVQPWRKRDEDFPGRGLKASITQARCGF